MSTSRKKLQKYGYRTGTVTGQAKNFTMRKASGQTSLLFFNVVIKNQLFGFRVRLHYNTDPDPNPSQASFGSGSLQIKGSKKNKKKFQEDFQ